MKRSNPTKMFILLGALLWVATSCQKDITTSAGSNPMESLKQADPLLQVLNSMCDGIIDESATAGKNVSPYNAATIAGACGTLFIDTLSMPHVISIDWGSVNCKGSDGHWRRGKISVTFTGSYRKPGAVYTYSTENFYMDNNRIDFSRVLTNMGYLAENGGNMHFSISENVTITFALHALGSISQQSEITREWVEGESTGSSSDDVYLLRGSHYTQTSGGLNLESEIKDPLRKENSYNYYVTGTEKTTGNANSSLDLVLDYGYPEGVRDNLALATYRDGHTEVVKL